MGSEQTGAKLGCELAVGLVIAALALDLVVSVHELNQQCEHSKATNEVGPDREGPTVGRRDQKIKAERRSENAAEYEWAHGGGNSSEPIPVGRPSLCALEHGTGDDGHRAENASNDTPKLFHASTPIDSTATVSGPASERES